MDGDLGEQPDEAGRTHHEHGVAHEGTGQDVGEDEGYVDPRGYAGALIVDDHDVQSGTDEVPHDVRTDVARPAGN